MDRVTWVLEPDVFSDADRAWMREAATRAGHDVVRWDDAWWASEAWPRLAERAVVFHGSLGNAAQIRERLPWRPGAYCDVGAFCCSTWYPRAARWLAHRAWCFSTVEALLTAPASALAPLGSPARVFVRPDSPLKPFSGRVLPSDAIDRRALDVGLYYDDTSLPVLLAPVRAIGREWRYVVVAGEVIAGSAYAADGRAAIADSPAGAPWREAQAIAAVLPAPEPVYVMDLCEADGELALLELNPFSGADLYACARDAVVAAVSDLAQRG